MNIFDFSQQGKRSNNEDSLGYSAGLFTVCDGMGGHDFGERASGFVKDFMLKAFPQPQHLGKMEIQQQLNKVQLNLNQLLENEPELENMGTTFTGIFLTPDVWYAAHIGDSRIYLFRPSEQKLWHTWDHSFVGELMRTREITTEAGRFHPMSNRISKALIAQKGGKPVSASIVKFDKLKSGDILLLCSDGVVEGWGDLELVQLFSDDTMSFEQKCEKLRQQCDEKSKDNNTAIVVEIEQEDAFTYGNNDELEWTTFAEVVAEYKQYLNDNMENVAKTLTKSNTETAAVEEDDEEEKVRDEEAEEDDEQQEPRDKPRLKVNLRRYWPIVTALLLVVAFAIFFNIWKYGTKPGEPNTVKPPQTESVVALPQSNAVSPSNPSKKHRTSSKEKSPNNNSQKIPSEVIHDEPGQSGQLNQVEGESIKTPNEGAAQEGTNQNIQESPNQDASRTNTQSHDDAPQIDDMKNSDDNIKQDKKEGE